MAEDRPVRAGVGVCDLARDSRVRVSGVRDACERLMDQAQGRAGLLVLNLEDGLHEHVLVRREDLELLLATWGEKRAE